MTDRHGAARSILKHAADPQGLYLGGVPTWFQSIGVPVYGRLAPVTYALGWDANRASGGRGCRAD
jgi:hypothetical protein